MGTSPLVAALPVASAAEVATEQLVPWVVAIWAAASRYARPFLVSLPWARVSIVEVRGLPLVAVARAPLGAR